MRARLVIFVVAAIAAMSMLAAAASASGPAPPGKQILQIDCAGLGTITVSVPRGENSNGVGQIVGQKGHGTPVAFTFTLTDVTTNTVLDTESSAVGKGHAHPNQQTVTCSGIGFEGSASDFFGSQLPPGVAPTDVIQASFTVDVILKP